MGRLADDMMRLREEISAGHSRRKALARDLKEERANINDAVADMQANFETQRRVRAEKVRNDLTKARIRIIEQVSGLGQQVGEMLADMRAELDAAGKTARDDRKAYLASLQHQVRNELAAAHDERSSRAEQIRSDLHAHRQQTVDTVAALLATCRQWRQTMPDLKGEVTRLRTNCRKELAEAAQAGAADRRAYLSSIRHSLASMIAEYHNFRRGVLNELDDLHRTWHGQPETGTATPDETDPDPEPETFVQPQTEVDAPPPVEPKEAEPQQPETRPETPETADDLTLISGIGPERQKRLNAAGVFTFGHLAEQDVGQLVALMNHATGESEIQKWIDQARELTLLV